MRNADHGTTYTYTGNSNSHGARPVHLTITMIKWTRTSRLSINNSLSGSLDKSRSGAIDNVAIAARERRVELRE